MLITFVLAATMGSCAPGRECIDFTGTVSRGKEFSQAFGPGFVLVLAPTEFGWEVVIRDGRLTENIARLTPPFRGVPNPRNLEGWHFRNADNSGPNEGTVNAPQRRRSFAFSPDVGRTINYPPTPEQVSQLEQAGQGHLLIRSISLGGLVLNRKAHIERMDFRVTLSWPSSWRKGSPK